MAGPFNLTFEDLQTKWIIKGHVVNDVWTVENFYATPSIKKVKIYFNIIKGSKEISEYINSNIYIHIFFIY